MTDYLYDPFPDSAIHPTQEECLAFLATLSTDDLSGPAGYFVLAMALEGEADVKKKAKALLRRKGAPAELLDTQKAFGREKSTWKVYKGLTDGKEGRALEEMNFAIHRIFTTFGSDSLMNGIPNIPPHHMDKLIVQGLDQRMQFTFEGESFSGKNVAMKLKGVWPKALILDAIAKLPEEVRVLEFGVKDPCALRDISLPPNLLYLKIRGPIHGMDAVEQMETLRTLHASHGVDLKDLCSPHLQYVNFEETNLPDWEKVPNIKGAYISYPTASSLGELGVLTELTSLVVFGETDKLDGLPDLSTCTELTKLEVYNVPIGVLPDWIGDLEKLETIQFTSGLHTLSAGLAKLKLKDLRLEHMTLEQVPELVGEAPEYVSLYKTTVPEDIPASAYCFLKLPSTQQAASELTFFLQQYPGTKALKALEDFMMGDKSAPISEALLAVTRVHVDDEHGPSTNDYLCKLLGESGGDVERTANDTIPKRFFGSAVSVTNAETKLAKVSGIDANQFRLFCEEMMTVDEGRGLR